MESRRLPIFMFALLLGMFPAARLWAADPEPAIVGPYDSAVTGVPNFSCDWYCRNGPGSKEFLTVGQRYRVRQDGTIQRVRLYAASTKGLTGFYVKIWRYNGATYDLIGASENIVAKLVAGGISTVDLASPIAGVQEGDYYGFRIEAQDDTPHFVARTGVAGVASFWVVNSSPGGTAFAWESQNQSPGAVFPIELYMVPPAAVFIGDSIISGYPAHRSFLEPVRVTNIASTIERNFADLSGGVYAPYQNMGSGGGGSQTTLSLASRFDADVIRLKSRLVVIAGGRDNLSLGGTQSAFLSDWASMLNAAQADAAIEKVVVLKIPPWTGGSTAQMNTRDDWNASLVALAANYSKATVVDAGSYVGQYRPSGPPGNLWDIRPEYTADGKNYNASGNAQIAQAIAAGLELAPPPPPDTCALDPSLRAIAGPYDKAEAGAGNFSCDWFCNSGAGTKEFITVGQSYRIRQDGTLSRVRLHAAATGGLTGFYVKVWRFNGVTYDLVGTSNNIAGNLVANSITTVELTAPIAGVREGDYYGFRIEALDNTRHFHAKLGVPGVSSYWVVNAIPSSTGYDWASRSQSVGAVFPIELYMTPPQAVFIGDSIIAGHENHWSFLETEAVSDIDSTIERRFAELSGMTYQNMGIGGELAADVAARFTADALNLNPIYAVVEGGINDISVGGSEDAFLAAWDSMPSAAQADPDVAVTVVLLMLPWTGGSNAQMQRRDAWNASLAALAATYSKAVVIDAGPHVGQFRLGGDANNLWDIQPQYDENGIHFTAAGHARIAEAIYDALAAQDLLGACPASGGGAW